MKHWHTFLFTLIASLIAIAPLHAATPAARAWLDRDTMHLGETVTLNVETEGDAGGQPSFSALSQDFSMLGTQSSQQVSIVNGSSSAKTVWAVGLEPKHAGRITIPALTVGSAQTAPIALTVLAQPAGAQGKPGDDVFLEVTAEPLTPYVQQQVRYTVKLYFSFGLTDGNLSEPQADGIVVQRLGQDKSYLATVGDRRYHVMERHYALTPEKSGALELPALAFRGNALDAADPTGFFSRPRTISARSDAVQLQVRPKPATWTSDPWLPAESMLLKDDSDLPTEIRVGDPVTRTIRLQAQGLGFEQLPELNLTAPEGAEIYPDKPDTRTRDDGTWLYGERVRKFAFVPTKPGTLTIPGMSVSWWDTAHDRLQTTELAAHTLTVLPPAGKTTNGAAAATASPADGEAANVAPSSPSIMTPTPARPPSVRVWQVLAALGFLLWLATLALWWRSRRADPIAAANAPPASGISAQRAAFLRAAALGELAGAERALVAWARSERPDVRNLGELGVRLQDAAQREALAALQRSRYAGASAQGVGSQLERAFKGGFAWTRPAAASKNASPLPALYPE
ncbi:MAG TPA: BatD family protein [Rhodanobacteraceae bacterium]|nr:BatD family protein [Rhodanobacteraceae bacterium]